VAFFVAIFKRADSAYAAGICGMNAAEIPGWSAMAASLLIQPRA
jgi:hypothetical protein